MRVTAEALAPEVIQRVRDEARATGDVERARCCSAALGLPIGDGALGLLDAATCRARLAEIVNNNLSCGLNTYGVVFEPVTAETVTADLDARDARRYRRLRVLGAAPCGTRDLNNGTVMCFTTLDAFVDADIAAHPSRGEASS